MKPIKTDTTQTPVRIEYGRLHHPHGVTTAEGQGNVALHLLRSMLPESPKGPLLNKGVEG